MMKAEQGLKMGLVHSMIKRDGIEKKKKAREAGEIVGAASGLGRQVLAGGAKKEPANETCPVLRIPS